MIHIRNLPDTDLIIDDPELYREVTSYLLYCRHELQEYADEDDIDDHDFSFSVLQEEDLPKSTRGHSIFAPSRKIFVRVKSIG